MVDDEKKKELSYRTTKPFILLFERGKLNF